MANRIILTDKLGNTVKINGVCYEYLGTTRNGVTNSVAEVDAVYDNCTDCESSSSSSSSISNSSNSSSSSSCSSSSSISNSSSSSSSSSSISFSNSSSSSSISFSLSSSSSSNSSSSSSFSLSNSSSSTSTVDLPPIVSSSSSSSSSSCSSSSSISSSLSSSSSSSSLSLGSESNSSSSSESLSYVSGCNHFGCSEDIPTDITVTFSGLNTTNFPGVNGTPVALSYVGVGSCSGYGCTWEGSIGGKSVQFITGIGLGFDSWYVTIGFCSEPTQCYYEFLAYDEGGGFPGNPCDPRVGSIPKYACWYAGCSDTSDCDLENPTASISY